MPFSERKLYQVLATPGVSAVQKHLIRFAQWKKPDGGQESVIVIGVDLTGSVGRPWQLVAGSADCLAEPDAVFIDELYLRKLGIPRVGDHRRDSRASRARGRLHPRHPHVHHVAVRLHLVQARAGLHRHCAKTRPSTCSSRRSPAPTSMQVRQTPSHRGSPTSSVRTTREFSRLTRTYWMFTTGAGIAVLHRRPARPARRSRGRRADHLRDDRRSHSRIRHVESDGRDQSLSLHASSSSRPCISALIGYALGMTASMFVVRGSSARRSQHHSARLHGRRPCSGPDARRCASRRPRVHQQSHSARSRHGVQGVIVPSTPPARSVRA